MSPLSLEDFHHRIFHIQTNIPQNNVILMGSLAHRLKLEARKNSHHLLAIQRLIKTTPILASRSIYRQFVY